MRKRGGDAPIRSIVFPSDLGPGSKPLFRRVLKLAGACRARLTVVHGLPRPIEPLIQEGASLFSGAAIPSPELITDAEEAARAVLVNWMKEADRAGVKATFALQPEPIPVRDVILAAARKSDLIAMGAQSGPIVANLVGSITRQIVREARCPVWVIHA